MAFADFVQSEDKIISKSVKEDLKRLKTESDTKLKHISDAYKTMLLATTDGIVSGLADTSEDINDVITGVDFSGTITTPPRIQTPIPTPTPTPEMEPESQKTPSDSGTEEIVQAVHTTHIAEVAQNDSLLGSVKSLNTNIIDLGESVDTISAEMIGNSTFAEEQDREQSVYDDDMLDAAEATAEGIGDIASGLESDDEKTDVGSLLKAIAAAGLIVGIFKGKDLLKGITLWRLGMVKRIKDMYVGIGKGMFNITKSVALNVNRFIIQPLGSAFKKFSPQWLRNIGTSIGQKGMPVLNRLRSLFQWFRNNRIVSFLDDIIRTGTGAASSLFSKIKSVFDVFKSVAMRIPGVAGLVKKVGLVVGKVARFAGLVGVIIMVVDALVQGIMGAFKGWTEGGTLYEKIVGGITGAIRGVWKSIVGDLTNLVFDLIGFMIGGIGKLFGIKGMSKMGDAIKKFDIMVVFDMFMDTVKWFFLVAVPGVFKGIKMLFSKDGRKKLWKVITTAISDLISTIWEGLKNIVGGIGSRISNWWKGGDEDLKSTIPHKGKTAEAFKESFNSTLTTPEAALTSTPIGTSPTIVPFTPMTVEERMDMHGRGEQYKEWKEKNKRGKGLMDTANENKETERSITNIITTNQLIPQTAVQVSNGTTTVAFPESGTDQNATKAKY